MHHNQWDRGKIDDFKAFVIMNRKHMHSVTSIEVKDNFIIWSSNLLFGMPAIRKAIKLAPLIDIPVGS